jgi:hypothetical protein
MGSLVNPSTPIPQFQDSDIPLEPTRLRAGDSWNWTRSFPNYPSTTYTLSYILNSPNNRFVFPSAGITPDPDGQGFDIQMTAAQTADVVADTYDFVVVLTGITGTASDGQQVTWVLQSVGVDPNLATASAPVDTRSFVKQTLDVIEAAISGNTRPDVQEYMINGRQLRKLSPLDLEKFHSIYLNKYRAEQRARGEYAPRKQVIGFRFNVQA